MLPAIRTAVRTGDTPTSERQRMVKHPPHILVTTPESLFILLTAERSRQALRSVKTVIVDEIHAMADDKRGRASRAVARAARRSRREGRRRAAAAHRPVGDGQADRDRRALSCARRSTRRSTIINHGHRRAMDLAVEVPQDELGPVASNEMWQEIYDRITALIQRAQDDARLRQHEAAGRARRAQSRPSGSAKMRCSPITAACRASCG